MDKVGARSRSELMWLMLQLQVAIGPSKAPQGPE